MTLISIVCLLIGTIIPSSFFVIYFKDLCENHQKRIEDKKIFNRIGTYIIKINFDVYGHPYHSYISKSGSFTNDLDKIHYFNCFNDANDCLHLYKNSINDHAVINRIDSWHDFITDNI